MIISSTIIYGTKKASAIAEALYMYVKIYLLNIEREITIFCISEVPS